MCSRNIVIKIITFVICPFVFQNTYGQIIETVAGIGSGTHSGDGGFAIYAGIGYPGPITCDLSGNFYFGEGDGCWIRKVTPCGIITTIAGTGVCGYNGDGIMATAAELNGFTGIACDSFNNLYIADKLNNRIRKIDANTGFISTIAGVGLAGFGGDGGPATSSILYNPENICIDKYENIYILDAANFRIRIINNLGIINTYAGNGIAGYSGDGGQADSASIENLSGICIDMKQNLFFSQLIDCRVRKVDSLGIISTIAGNGSFISSGDGGLATSAGIDPTYLANDLNGNLFISGYLNNNIRKVNDSGIISTIAGNGISGFFGDGGEADSAELNRPYGIAINKLGNLYVSDFYNERVRRVVYFYLDTSCATLNVNNLENKEDLHINPNPTNSIINIDFNSKYTEVTVFDMFGKIVFNQNYSNEKIEINLAQLRPGIYIVKTTDNRDKCVFSRLIKEN